MSDATTQPLKPFAAQYRFTLAADGLADAARQQRDFLEMARDLGFYPAGQFATALGEMNPLEVIPGSVLEQELQGDLRGGASERSRGVVADAPSGRSRVHAVGGSEGCSCPVVGSACTHCGFSPRSSMGGVV